MDDVHRMKGLVESWGFTDCQVLLDEEGHRKPTKANIQVGRSLDHPFRLSKSLSAPFPMLLSTSLTLYIHTYIYVYTYLYTHYCICLVSIKRWSQLHLAPKAAIAWLVDGAEAGDMLFLHYSGHGGRVERTDGRGEWHETLCPLDMEEAGMLLDSELFEPLAGLSRDCY